MPKQCKDSCIYPLHPTRVYIADKPGGWLYWYCEVCRHAIRREPIV